ncbi:MAG: lipocalin family protein, partial [Flavitalea sp.]
GTWGIGTTVASATNMHINEGNIITHYTFDSDGTYSFYRKTFRFQLDKLLLTRETGTYQLNGNQLTVNPQKSVIEAWSKKDGTDNWGKLLSSDQRELEKTTYSFSTEDYGLGMVLILKAGKETKRDGYFNNSGKDAWFYPAMKSVEFIKLP